MGDRKFPKELCTEPIEEALGFLRKDDEPEEWSAAICFEDAYHLYNLSCKHTLEAADPSVLEAYCALLAAGREKVTAMPLDFAAPPLEEIRSGTKLHGKARLTNDEETNKVWKENKIAELRRTCGSRTQLILVPMQCYLTDRPALIVRIFNCNL